MKSSTLSSPLRQGVTGFFVLLLQVFAASGASLRPTDLRCEYLTDPLGIGTYEPRLSWITVAEPGSTRGVTQSAYQILVASDPKKLARDQGDLWDTGRTNSNRSTLIRYAGGVLFAEQECFW